MSKQPGRFGKFTEAEVEAGTDAGTGRGNPKLHESSGIVEEKVAHGQTVKRAYPLDTSDTAWRDGKARPTTCGTPSTAPPPSWARTTGTRARTFRTTDARLRALVSSEW
jgi:hypothetical protein